MVTATTAWSAALPSDSYLTFERLPFGLFGKSAPAKHVDVEVDGEMVSFDEYIKGVRVAEGHGVRVPGNASVRELASKINPGADQIRDRLRPLALDSEAPSRR